MGRYTLKIQASHIEKVDSLSGFLLLSDSCTGIPQSMYMDSISLTRGYNPSMQDELMNRIESIKAFRSSDRILFRPDTLTLYPY